MFMVDTNVISALSPAKAKSDPELARWFAEAAGLLRFSVVQIAEIRSGVVSLRIKGAAAKADRIERWWEQIETDFADCFLDFDAPAAAIAAGMLGKNRHRTIDFADVVIAATAASRDLTVLTANAADFAPLGAPFANPFEALPPLPH